MVAAPAGNAMRAAAPSPVAVSVPTAQVAASTLLASFADVVALAGQKRELKLKHALETTLRLVAFEPGKIEVAVTAEAPAGLAGELSRKLEEWTGARWMIAVSRDGGGATIAEARREAQERLVDDARADPLVAAVLQRFPGAEIVDVRVRSDAPETPLSAPEPLPANPDDLEGND
jgi:DNA polymerase-3 subunit gamma/tau